MPAPTSIRPSNDGSDGGFTLIEVMIAVMLLGVVMGALGMAAIVFIKNMTETQARLDVSNSRSFTSRYVVGDIQSAAVYRSGSDPSGSIPTGATGLPTEPVSVPGTPVTTCTTTPQPAVQINGYGVYDATYGPPNAGLDRLFRIDYVVVDDGTGDCQLRRLRYEWANVSPAPSLVAVEEITVARDLLVDGTTPPVVFAPDPGGDPEKWQVTVRLKPKSSTVVDYDYQVWAKRRVQEILP